MFYFIQTILMEYDCNINVNMAQMPSCQNERTINVYKIYNVMHIQEMNYVFTSEYLAWAEIHSKLLL